MSCMRAAGWIAIPALLVTGLVAAQPKSAGPTVSVEAIADTNAAHPGSVVRLAVHVRLGSSWHVNAHQPKDEYLIPTVLDLTPPEGVTITEIVYPEPIPITLEGATDTLASYGEDFVIGVALVLADTIQPGTVKLEGTLQYQACDKKQCYPPKTVPVSLSMPVVPAGQPVTPQHSDLFASIRFCGAEGSAPMAQAPTPAPASAPEGDWGKLAERFVVKGTASGYLNVKDFLAFLDGVESGRAQSAPNPLANKAAWLVVLLVIGGGLLLNLTPCVLPLIPINLGIIGAGAKAGSKTRGFLLGGTYGAGIALTYGGLGLVVVLGVSKTFGGINSTPWFNGVIALIFVALGLAMFDVFLIDFTAYQTRIGVKRKAGGSFLVAFLMGAISALLAGACVAPVIISTIVYAQNQYAKGAAFALLLPFLVGVGMALPWPFAGAGLSFLPKPGKWMERVKHGFGVLIFGFAIYYGYLAYALFSDRYWVDREAVNAAAQQMDKEGWQPSLTQGLARAEREHQPVFIDFWATWCKNCLTMNQTTFKNGEVAARLDRYVKVKYQAEDFGDPATQEAMGRFAVIGLPTYVILESK